MKKAVNSRLPTFTREERLLVQGSYDYIGLNHYTSKYYTEAHTHTHTDTDTDTDTDRAGDIDGGQNRVLFDTGSRASAVQYGGWAVDQRAVGSPMGVDGKLIGTYVRGGVHASDGRRCHPSIRGDIYVLIVIIFLSVCVFLVLHYDNVITLTPSHVRTHYS